MNLVDFTFSAPIVLAALTVAAGGALAIASCARRAFANAQEANSVKTLAQRVISQRIDKFVRMIPYQPPSPDINNLLRIFADIYEWVGKEHFYIIEALATISNPSERERFVKLLETQRLIHYPDKKWVLIIEAIASIKNQGEREHVVKLAQRLFTEKMTCQERAKIIGVLASIQNQGEREHVVKLAQRLFTEKMNGEERAKIIKALEDIHDPAEREHVAELAQRFFTEDMNCRRRLFVIQSLKEIPNSAERDHILELAQRLFTEHMDVKERLLVILAIGSIPLRSERDRMLEMTPLWLTENMNGEQRAAVIASLQNIDDLAEREHVARVARNFIRPEMNANAIADLFDDIARRVDLRRPIEAVNVHSGNRDERTKNALIELRKTQQGRVSKASETNYREYMRSLEPILGEFWQYVGTLSIEEQEKVRLVLQGSQRKPDFGPFFTQDGFTILGLETSGQEIIARLWEFCKGCEGNDQENAKRSMISALLDCIDEIGRLVCNIGKAQRVLLAVLQGRESGVNIDNVEIPTVDQLTQQFFENPEIRGIKKREELLEKACEFCQALPKGSQEPFLKKIKDCIEQLEQDWEAAAAAEAAHA